MADSNAQLQNFLFYFLCRSVRKLERLTPAKPLQPSLMIMSDPQ
jgi:hypothetical protein